MKITGNEPFHMHVDTDRDGSVYTERYGITIRQAFAMASMQGRRASETKMASESIAILAVKDADALIAELNRTE